MPPVFGPGVAVAEPLEVLRRQHRQHAVSPSVIANSDTSGPSRYSSITTRSHAARVRERGLAVVGDDDALAGGEAVVLHDVRRTERVERVGSTSLAVVARRAPSRSARRPRP